MGQSTINLDPRYGIVLMILVAMAAGVAVAIDAPNHGDRPKNEEFGRIAAEMRAGMAAGENLGALVAGVHSYLAGQAVADWQAALTAEGLCGRVLGRGWWPCGGQSIFDGCEQGERGVEVGGVVAGCRGDGRGPFVSCKGVVAAAVVGGSDGDPAAVVGVGLPLDEVLAFQAAQGRGKVGAL